MKIHYVSDLHLEFGVRPPKLAKEFGGEVLILAGDILTAESIREHRTDARARSLKKYLKTKFKDFVDKFDRVFYIPGNHEYYGSIWKNTIPELRAQFDNLGLNKIEIFNNNHVVVDDVLFVGSTLWTDFAAGSPVVMNEVQAGMNDYHYIGRLDLDDMNYFNRHESRLITAEFILQEHLQSISYIRQTLELHKGIQNVVVFTHMAPTYKSINTEHSGNVLDHAYASNLSEFILDHPQIKYWIHGHTHQSTEYKVGDSTTVVSNQLGYSHERSFREFNGTRSFEL